MTKNAQPRALDVSSSSLSASGSLPQPPAAQVLSLPREPHAKPQETAIAVNPRNPDNVIISYHQAVGEGSDHHPNVDVQVNIAFSFDAGRTWSVASETTHPNYRRSIDATVAFDLHGTAYLAYIGMDTMRFFDPTTTRHGEFVARSVDGGRTWERPITLAERPETAENAFFDHMPHIAVDNYVESPYAGNVYIIWDRYLRWDHQSYERGLLSRAASEQTVLVRSTDGGESWTEPRVIADHAGLIFTAAAVGTDGTVYVAVAEGRDEGEYTIRLYTSRDGGDTFVASGTVARGGGSPVMAIDGCCRQNRLIVAWSSQPHGDSDIFVTTSEDVGATWSPPVRVNDDPPGNGADQFMPWLAVDPTDGTTYVIFYDRRRDPKSPNMTMTLARSVDGGRTFKNYAWSDAHYDPTVARLGDYIGLAAVDGRVFAAWMENALDDVGDISAERAAELAESDEWQSSPYRDWPFGPSVIKVGLADFGTHDL